jgi:hypothetical protein
MQLSLTGNNADNNSLQLAVRGALGGSGACIRAGLHQLAAGDAPGAATGWPRLGSVSGRRRTSPGRAHITSWHRIQ